jgi:vacuolar-type H+-ATPase subunit C/Vma6
MLRAKDLVELFDILLKSDYSPELSKISMKELDAYQLERIFYQKLSDRFSFLFKITSGKTREVLKDYYREIEVENVKRIIRVLHGKEKLTQDQLIPIPRRFQTVNFSALLEARTIREMVDFLRETPYRDLRKGIELYERYDNPTLLEAQLDNIFFDDLWQNLKGLTDKNKIRRLIGTEADLKNLLYVFSLKLAKMKPETIQETIIDVHYKLPKPLLQQLIDAPYEMIPRLLTWPSYAELAKKTVGLLEKELPVEAESTFSHYLYTYAEKAALRNPNSLVYVFAYLQLCFREARNLTTLVIGKQLKLNEGKIQSLLFL